MTGDQNDIFARLKGYLPTRWFGAPSDASPVVDAVLKGVANVLAFVYSLYAYAKLQTRIATATDGWLDLIAADYLGAGLPRKTGESDASYRARIQANLFREKATRNAITQTLTALTGRAPVLIEPTRPEDTGAYGHNPPALLVGASVYRDDGYGNQLLYPTPRTNQVLHSGDFTNPVWVNGYDGTGTAPVVTPNYAAAPDGSMTATRVQLSRGAGGNDTDWSALYQETAALSQDETANLWVKSNAGTVRAYLFTLDAVVLATITPQWQLVSALQTDPALQDDGATDTAVDLCIWHPQLEGAAAPGVYIPTDTDPVTVTDYSINSFGQVTLPAPPVLNAVLTVTSPSDGLPAGSPLGTGNGYTTIFSTSVPTGPYAPAGYGMAGAYGSLSLAYQAFVVAYRPHSGQGIANVAGYGISTGGYGAASQADYATLASFTGGVLDSDIYAAVAAVKPEGSVVWVGIKN